MALPVNGARGATLVVADEPQEIEQIELNPSRNVAGELVEQVTLGRYTRVSLSAIAHIPSLGSTTTSVGMKGIPSSENRPWPGLLLMWLGDWDDDLYVKKGGRQWPPRVAICQNAFLVHHGDVVYYRTGKDDVASAYTTYQYSNGPIPFGDMNEVWTVACTVTPTFDGGGSPTGNEMTVTISGSLHPGVEYSIGPVTLTLATDLGGAGSIFCGRTWESPDPVLLDNIPENAVIVTGSILLNGSTGADPVMTGVTGNDYAIMNSFSTGSGRTPSLESATATVDPPETITGYYASFNGIVPAPLEGTFTNDFPRAVSGLGGTPASGSTHQINVWAASSGLKVSPVLQAPIFMVGLTCDGRENMELGGQYRTDSEYMVDGGVLQMHTPNTGDAITYRIWPGGGYSTDALFEFEGNVLKFKDPPVYPPPVQIFTPENCYGVVVEAEDEHGIVVNALFRFTYQP